MSKLKYDDGAILEVAAGKSTSQTSFWIAAVFDRWDIGLAAALAATVPFVIWAAAAIS